MVDDETHVGMSSERGHRGESSGTAAAGFRINVPNAFCVVRLAGSPGLIALAIMDRPLSFVVGFLLLVFTDWIDGRLAVWLDQRSTFGARFDSVADAAMYGALLFGCVWFRSEALVAERMWIVAALSTYFVSCILALVKFHRLPSHHTYSAKVSAVATVVAALALLSDWAIWPLRVAMVAVSCANLESATITLLSDQWKADVPTIWHALRDR
jgi:CDP-diacylglycerol--glycerol-3-phosphate 3-phosphatidyltransferase